MAESYVPSLWVCENLTYEHTFCPRTEPSDLLLAVDLMKKLSFSISVTTSLSHTCRFNTPPHPHPLLSDGQPESNNISYETLMWTIDL